MSILDLSIWFSFLASLVAAFLNSYILYLKGGEVDAERFLSGAADWAASGNPFELTINYEFFVQYLGIFVRYLGADRFFLSILGVLVFFGTLGFVVKYIKKIQISSSSAAFLATNNHPSTENLYLDVNTLPARLLRYSILYLALLSPSVILRIGNVLREPYVIAGLLLVGFSLLTLRPNIAIKRQLKFVLVFGIGSILMLPFHKASIFFCLFAIFVVFGIYLLSAFSKEVSAATKKKIIKNLSFLLLYLLSFLLLSVPILFSAIGKSSSGEQIAMIFAADTESVETITSRKQDRDDGALSQYSFDTNFSNPLSISNALALSYVYYFLYPFKPSRPVEIFAFFENTLRVLFLITLFRVCRNVDNRNKHASNYVLTIIAFYLLCSLIFAAGTANFGTGSRHHMTLMPLFLLVYPLIRTKSSLRLSTCP